jgi:hypothetical protein
MSPQFPAQCGRSVFCQAKKAARHRPAARSRSTVNIKPTRIVRAPAAGQQFLVRGAPPANRGAGAPKDRPIRAHDLATSC